MISSRGAAQSCSSNDEPTSPTCLSRARTEFAVPNLPCRVTLSTAFNQQSVPDITNGPSYGINTPLLCLDLAARYCERHHIETSLTEWVVS
jgi:hypothetical protein